jgi:hypothetical protein
LRHLDRVNKDLEEALVENGSFHNQERFLIPKVIKIFLQAMYQHEEFQEYSRHNTTKN